MEKKRVRTELIGCSIQILDAKNKSLIGIQGKIVDETKNTFTIETKDHSRKKLIKNQITMKIKMKNQAIEIEGKGIVGRPEERIKK